MSVKTERHSKNGLKQLGMQLIAGGSAGCVEVSIMHPLDLIKTRFQIQSSKVLQNSHSEHYTGVFDCFKKMYRSEGLLSFWKGVIPPILVETPKRAWKFCTFEQFKNIMVLHQNQPQAVTFMFAGLCSGLSEAILVNPFEVVKVKMQSNRHHRSVAPTTFSVARSIAQDDGFLGSRGLLTKGITATMGRNGFFNMVYFGFYHTVKNCAPSFEDHRKEFFRKLLIGFTAGVLASCCNIPFDVAKSRIQGPQPNPPSIKYSGTFKSIVIIAKEEGVLALYKGLFPKLLRLGPGGAVMLLVYEHVLEYLENKYLD